MPLLDRTQLEAIVDAVCERLEGDWLLIGGAIAALWFSPRRTTEDLDIIGLRGETNERLALMSLAESLGLPIETMNSAADFFVHRIPGWRDQIIPFRAGSKGCIYRPSATLFLLLKLGRLDERDLEDCRGAIASGEAFDANRVRDALDALASPTNEALASRRAELRALLGP